MNAGSTDPYSAVNAYITGNDVSVGEKAICEGITRGDRDQGIIGKTGEFEKLFATGISSEYIILWNSKNVQNYCEENVNEIKE